ncbi:MAG: hypothetical protein E5W90_26430 [Mesorhizobium sp.]|nr:MAG: hypothetical protein E5W90_26430 [Mesorhizobium sp.]
MRDETELQMVERHVRECDGRIVRQREIVARLVERGQPTDLALELLWLFEWVQKDHLRHLLRLQLAAG